MAGDVMVGDDQPLGADDHAGAERGLFARRGERRFLAEEAAKERVLDDGRALGAARAGIDIHHGRRGLLDQRGVAEPHLRGRRRKALRDGCSAEQGQQ